ncbi:MAG: GTP cyclohydrolase, FolE2/MptA family, partial [Terriglobia bacterium]
MARCAKRIRMNAPERVTLDDVQSRPDSRNIRIDAVGVKGMRYPVTIQAGERLVLTIATLSMTVALAAVETGTHMSRFVELLEAQTEPLNMLRFKGIVVDMLDRLEAPGGAIE